MAVTTTLVGVAQVLPIGTSVGAYPAANRGVEGSPPTSAPSATATVAADGSLAFSGLVEGGEYVAAASVGGVWRKVQFWGAFAADNPAGAVTQGVETQDSELLAAIAAHAADTSTHGIADTADLALRSRNFVNVRDYGAVGDGTADDTQAFVAAHAALPASGGAIYVPPGIYRTTALITFTKPVWLLGAGAGINVGTIATEIRPDAGVAGFLVDTAAQYSRLENFFLNSQSTGSGTDDGIRVKGHACEVAHVVVRKFGRRGVSVDTSSDGNANNSIFRGVRCVENRGDGFYVKGANSQAMLFEACDASINGGWGFNDDDSGSNTFVAIHCDGNTSGAVRDNGSTNQFFNPYVESGTGANVTLSGTQALWLAGIYTNPAITDSGSGNIVLQNAKWSVVNVLGNLFMTGPSSGIYSRGNTALGNVIFGGRIDTDTVDRMVITASSIQLGPGNAARDVQLSRGDVDVLNIDDDLAFAVVGMGPKIKEGANAKMGVATLAAGAVTVSTTKVTANSRIFLTKNSGASTGSLRVSARVAGTSFTITSSDGADTSTVAWMIVEPA